MKPLIIVLGTILLVFLLFTLHKGVKVAQQATQEANYWHDRFVNATCVELK